MTIEGPMPTPAQVIARLRKRHRDGLSMDRIAFWPDERRLYHAAKQRFGSYRKALLAAGLDPD